MHWCKQIQMYYFSFEPKRTSCSQTYTPSIYPSIITWKLWQDSDILVFFPPIAFQGTSLVCTVDYITTKPQFQIVKRATDLVTNWGDGTLLITTSELSSCQLEILLKLLYTEWAYYLSEYQCGCIQCASIMPWAQKPVGQRALFLRKSSTQWCVMTANWIWINSAGFRQEAGLVWGWHWWRLGRVKSVRASVSMTESIVSMTIDHCLQCQFKLSPLEERHSEVQSKTSPHTHSSRCCCGLCRFQWINAVWTGSKFSHLCWTRKVGKTELCWLSTWWKRCKINSGLTNGWIVIEAGV